jgi:hypothetical protein
LHAAAALNCAALTLIRVAKGYPAGMPTLFRFLVTVGVMAALAYGAMFALAAFVEPKKGEITVRVPLDRLGK